MEACRHPWTAPILACMGQMRAGDETWISENRMICNREESVCTARLSEIKRGVMDVYLFFRLPVVNDFLPQCTFPVELFGYRESLFVCRCWQLLSSGLKLWNFSTVDILEFGLALIYLLEPHSCLIVYAWSIKNFAILYLTNLENFSTSLGEHTPPLKGIGIHRNHPNETRRTWLCSFCSFKNDHTY